MRQEELRNATKKSNTNVGHNWLPTTPVYRVGEDYA